MAIKTKIKEYMQDPKYSKFAEILKEKTEIVLEHKFLPYKETLEEISKMNIPIQFEMESDDDIEINCSIIDVIQGYKDRLTNLYCFAERDLNIVESCYQSLVNIWMSVFSRMSSDKKREGEAEMLFSFLDKERLKRKEVLFNIKAHIKNMSDKFFSISRKSAIHEHTYRLVGTGYIDHPGGFEKALKSRRPIINEKMKKIREKIANGAKGWDTVLSS